jgi:RNA polymerase sigma-70 factor (ECF subfamily)
MELGDHLFRRESGRLVAALTRVFGIHNLALAEDVVQDAFCRALEVWPFRGVPDNPSAWLMATARNRAIDVLRRERRVRTFAPELGRLLESEWSLVPLVDEALAGTAIKDDVLRMMFSCCHPRLRDDVQVALVLHLLCGFGIGETAAAFLSTEAAMHKRLSRGKKVLATSKRLFDLTDAEFASRLSAVQRALYLLFNEGYHGASTESAVRAELCHEATRLVLLLIDHRLTASPASYALGALMHLHAARLPARLDAEGNLSSLVEQNRSKWDPHLIDAGLELLDRSATGTELTEYHVEAAIAAVHAKASAVDKTDWHRIVGLYDTLMTIRPSPVVALNRAIAIAQSEGPARGLQEIHAIDEVERLEAYPFYYAALAELELQCERLDLAREHFLGAIARARSPMEHRFLQQRLEVCGEPRQAKSIAPVSASDREAGRA